jgi:hypothetical protein
VRADVDKIARYLSRGVCQSGYVIVFEECDWGFASTFALEAELSHGCKVRFLSGYSRTCPECDSEAALPIVWGMPGPEPAEREVARERLAYEASVFGSSWREIASELGYSDEEAARAAATAHLTRTGTTRSSRSGE